MANQMRDYPVPMVFKAIHLKKSSGELDIRSRNFNKRLYFMSGLLESASSDLTSERLGKVLQIKGLVQPQKLQQLEDTLGKTNSEAIASSLLGSGILNPKELHGCLVSQALLIAANSFGLQEGEWTFVRGMAVIPGGKTFHIPLDLVIREGVKEIVDFAYYQNLFSEFHLQAKPLPDTTQKLLTPFNSDFYKSALPFSGQVTRHILDKMAIAPDIFWREVVMFYLLNVFEFSEADRTAAHAETAINTLVTATQAAAVEPPPQSPAVEKPLPMEPIIEIDLGDERPEAEPAADRPRPPVDARAAKEAYKKASQLYEQKKYREAAALLVPVVTPETSSAASLFLLGQCFAQIPEFYKEAERHLKLAADKEPWNAEPYYVLGELYRSAGLMQKAETAFFQALVINKDHTLAGQAMAEIEAQHKKKFPFGRKK